EKGGGADEKAAPRRHPPPGETERPPPYVSGKGHAALDLNERTDLAAVSDDTAVQVDQLRVRDDDISADLDVGRDQRFSLMRRPARAAPRWRGPAGRPSPSPPAPPCRAPARSSP